MHAVENELSAPPPQHFSLTSALRFVSVISQVAACQPPPPQFIIFCFSVTIMERCIGEGAEGAGGGALKPSEVPGINNHISGKAPSGTVLDLHYNINGKLLELKG